MDTAEQTALADEITKQMATDLDAGNPLNSEALTKLVALPIDILIPAFKTNVTIKRIIKHNLDEHPILKPMFDSVTAKSGK